MTKFLNINRYLFMAFIMFALFFLIFSFATAATTYYVDGAGGDGGTGSNSNGGTSINDAWKTINYGLDHIQGGDTLFIRGGTYDEHIDDVPSGNGSWNTATVIKAYNKEEVIIRYTGDKLFVLWIQDGWDGIGPRGDVTEYVIFDGIDIDAGGLTRQDSGPLRVKYGPQYIRFVNCAGYNGKGSNFNIGSYTDYVEIINCDTYNSGGDPVRDGGVYGSGNYMLIDGVRAWNHASAGIFLRSSAADAGGWQNTNTIIRNNKVWNSGTGISTVTGNSHKIYNNVIWNITGTSGDRGGIVLLADYGDEVYNNTIYDVGRYGIFVDNKTRDEIIRNNIVYKTGSPTLFVETEGGHTGSAFFSHNLTDDGAEGSTIGDPFFVNPSDPVGPDNIWGTVDDGFQLQAGSPAIDAGTPISIFNDDFTGSQRPVDGDGDGIAKWDIGAYEYGGTVEPPETCISFTYDWLPAVCPVSEIQTPIVATSLPQGCTGGTPDLTPRTCTYIPVPTTFSTDPYLGDSINWEPLNTNRWEVTDDGGNLRYGINTTNYSQLSNDRLGEYSLIKNRTYDDFTFTAKVKSTENLTSNSYADYSIIFNYQDPNNYHYIVFNSNNTSSGLGKVVNGTSQDILTTTTSLITDNNYHNIKLQKTGSNIKVFFDNTQILNTTDTTLSQGQIGIGSLNDASLWDDITITTSQTILQGDLNNDNTVNTLDWSIMNANWGTSNSTADINNDGIVNTIDFSIMNGEWGQSV